METQDKVQVQNADIGTNQYEPISDICRSLDTVVPAAMRYELHRAMATIDRRVNDVDEYVAQKLGYIMGACGMDEREYGLKCLCDAFGAEQVDGIAAAIYNIEQRGQAVIIGDQTGIGKGRQAAGVIRYAMRMGKQPIFITEKPNLFSDILRDLIEIGSDDAIPMKFMEGYKEVKKTGDEGDDDGDGDDEEDDQDEVNTTLIKKEVYRPNPAYDKQIRGRKMVKPFILNSGIKASAKDENGNIIYESAPATVRNNAIENRTIPKQYGCVFATYSQFRGAIVTEKMQWLLAVAKDNIIILDESHNASGASNTGAFLAEVLKGTQGVVFLSATFAKRPDNMPIYATKTAIQDANMTSTALISAIERGGTALQEILSAQLVNEGQMIRRERSFEGIEVNYVYMDKSQDDGDKPYLNLEDEQKAVFDMATAVIRDIIDFQKNYVRPAVAAMNDDLRGRQGEAGITKGTESAGVSMPPEFSGVFNIINQLLFSVKADGVAQLIIDRLRQGKSVICAFANTMESFLDNMEHEDGTGVEVGDKINADFSVVLRKRLDGVLRYTVKIPGQDNEQERIDPVTLPGDGYDVYKSIMAKISQMSVGITMSPIDYVVEKIERAGFRVGEVTGRKNRVKFSADFSQATMQRRDQITATDAFRKFNDNELDVLMINQSGSTGSSAQAKATKRVPADKVRQRCMVILQAELNINTEVQKRGRINRTGQILKPIYDYAISAVPAEMRLMMMLQKKLKSLDANTTSNQKQSRKVLDTVDFLNKYGDDLTVEYLVENQDIIRLIGDPLKMLNENGGLVDLGSVDKTDAAHRVSGRVAILPIEDQERFYREMTDRYLSQVEYLKEIGEYDLEVEYYNLEAETIERQVIVQGKPGATTAFGRNTVLEKCWCNNLRKPFVAKDLRAIIDRYLGGRSAEDVASQQIQKMKTFMEEQAKMNFNDLIARRDEEEKKVVNEKSYRNLKTDAEKEKYLKLRLEEIREVYAEKMEADKQGWNNRYRNIKSRIDFFSAGRMIGYPSMMYEQDQSWYKGVCLGVEIKNEISNPYVPSQIKVRFAISNSLKSISLPMSKVMVLDTIEKITRDRIDYYESERVLDDWDEICSESSGDREIRYIVTGNILQGMGKTEIKGKLIDYTLKEGGKKKGILLPQGWDPVQGKDGPLKATVPIINALKIIKSMLPERIMTTTDQLSLIRKRDYGYDILVPLNKRIGGKFYQDPAIMELVIDGEFNKVGSNMKATLKDGKIEQLVGILQQKFNCAVLLNKNELNQIDSGPSSYKDEETKEPIGAAFEAEAKKRQQRDEIDAERMEEEKIAEHRRSRHLVTERKLATANLTRKLVVAAMKNGAKASDF
ncbi:MAG TPA: strawberry notch family protein [Sedimentisphaerales bacterium]|nr:strawberry notch family protein [Sedimentisphaerales bacterium]